MTDWTTLQDAYGSAAEIPSLLDQISPDPRADVWEELWSRLCHQGSVYSGSFAAIPRLTQAAAAWQPSDRPMVLSLAGAIFAGDDQASEFADMREKYQDELTRLRELTEETLASAAVAADEFAQVLQALMAFEGIRPWATEFDRLDGGEFEVSCPTCGTNLHVAIGTDGFFTSEDDYVVAANVKKQPLQPARPASLTSLAKRLYDAAMNAGHKELATSITYLFGDGTCVNCHQHFSVSERIEAESAT